MAKCPYRLDREPLGRGGYAEVFSGEHRDTGQVAGSSLRDAVQLHRTITRANFGAVLDDIAAELAYAHGRDYVHRDLTPNNVLHLGDHQGNRWVVADWGLVRRPLDLVNTRWTPTGQTLGTDGFIAPEVTGDAREATATSDVYSIGRLAEWLVTGRWPTEGVHDPVDDSYWGSFIGFTRHPDPSQRVQSMQGVRQILGSIAAAARPQVFRNDGGTEEQSPHDVLCPVCLTRVSGARCPTCGRYVAW
jgi:serine/threonine protein kinase